MSKREGAKTAGRRRRLRFGRMPDPARAHGAWVYLVLSVLAGVLTAIGKGFLPALLVGVGFAGVFVCASAVAILGKQGAKSRLAAGLSIAVVGPLLALYLGAPTSFLVFSAAALFPAALSGYFAERSGVASARALGFAVAALVVAAPSAACAGGASVRTGLVLLVLLAPFFAYRTLKTREAITTEAGWDRQKLRWQGIRETLYAVSWTLLVVSAIHLYGFLTRA